MEEDVVAMDDSKYDARLAMMEIGRYENDGQTDRDER